MESFLTAMDSTLCTRVQLIIETSSGQGVSGFAGFCCCVPSIADIMHYFSLTTLVLELFWVFASECSAWSGHLRSLGVGVREYANAERQRIEFAWRRPPRGYLLPCVRPRVWIVLQARRPSVSSRCVAIRLKKITKTMGGDGYHVT